MNIPHCHRHTLKEAFTLLEDSQYDAVFNPTDDGGYCLIGMREPHSALFEGIAWSTSTVMAETLSRARKHSLTVELAPAWYDVDDHAGLSRLANELKNTKAGT